MQHPSSVPIRVYAPPALVLGLACSAILCALGFVTLAMIVPVLYACFLGIGFFDGMHRSRRLLVALLEPAAIATMHLAFGFGWLRGFIRLRGRKAIIF